MSKFVFVTGGVVSGLGKGICAASLGRLLKQRGLSVTLQKFDPYINVDPGTMSPYQHGEVFVTDDGAETDLDLGHYERFVDESLNSHCSVSSGRIYWDVLNKERKGDYLGATVQIIPHISSEIKRHVYALSGPDIDVVITEIGGTVGDIESQPFLESIRQVANEQGRENVLFIHVPLIVKIPGSNELKSKPVQHSVKELLSIGIQPDIIVCRTDDPITEDIRRKISLFCNIEPECVIQNLTAPSLYQVPLYMQTEGLDTVVCKKLKLETKPADMQDWKAMTEREASAREVVRIALVGKYTALHDAYLSVVEALHHGGIANDCKVDIKWVDSELVTQDNVESYLSDVDGIIVPGGFGDRGIEGMIHSIQYAREKKVPLFGICLGMQMCVVEAARNLAKLEGAHSTEFVPEGKYPVIALMPEQYQIINKGGTMRLGKYLCRLKEGGKVREMYGSEEIWERHRHRFEYNNDFRKTLEDVGLEITGLSPDGMLVEIVEIKDHPWFTGVQFHPEFKSRPNRPHPLFKGFVGASKKHMEER